MNAAHRSLLCLLLALSAPGAAGVRGRLRVEASHLAFEPPVEVYKLNLKNGTVSLSNVSETHVVSLPVKQVAVANVTAVQSLDKETTNASTNATTKTTVAQSQDKEIAGNATAAQSLDKTASNATAAQSLNKAPSSGTPTIWQLASRAWQLAFGGASEAAVAPVATPNAVTLAAKAAQEPDAAPANVTKADADYIHDETPTNVTPAAAAPVELAHSGSPGEGGGHMVPRTHVTSEEAKTEKSHWMYSDPMAWAQGFPDCAGSGQSPIDIESGEVTTPEDEDTAFIAQHASYVALPDRSIKNNGHNVQVDGEFGTLALPDGSYEVKQFHLHFPSEHEVNGQLSAGEIHIVHQKHGSNGTADLAVVGILLEEDGDATESDPGIKFLKQLGFAGELPLANEHLPVAGEVDLNIFHSELSEGFWHYRGSLTTPPCSETVHWYVLQQPTKVSPEMMANVQAMFQDPQNNRPVQPLNKREVVFSEVGLPGEFKTAAGEEAGASAEAVATAEVAQRSGGPRHGLALLAAAAAAWAAAC